jgi:hypothetical protein
MDKIMLVSFILFFLLSVNLSSAVKIYVQPANQGVVRLNVTQFQTATAEKSFEIRNPNNFSMTINLEPSQNITKIIEIEKSFSLEPNESRRVNYVIKVSEPGTYDGSISITFNSDEGSVTYESKILVIANKSEFNYTLFLMPAIILVVIVLIVAFKKRIVVKKKVKR